MYVIDVWVSRLRPTRGAARLPRDACQPPQMRPSRPRGETRRQVRFGTHIQDATPAAMRVRDFVKMSLLQGLNSAQPLARPRSHTPDGLSIHITPCDAETSSCPA